MDNRWANMTKKYNDEYDNDTDDHGEDDTI